MKLLKYRLQNNIIVLSVQKRNHIDLKGDTNSVCVIYHLDQRPGVHTHFQATSFSLLVGVAEV